MPAERDRKVSPPAAEVPPLTGWVHPEGRAAARENGRTGKLCIVFPFALPLPITTNIFFIFTS